MKPMNSAGRTAQLPSDYTIGGDDLVQLIQQAKALATPSKSEYFNTGQYIAGIVAPGSKILFEFTKVSDVEPTQVKGNCGCTNVKYEFGKITGTVDIGSQFTNKAGRFLMYSKTISVSYPPNGGKPNSELLKITYVVDKYKKPL